MSGSVAAGDVFTTTTPINQPTKIKQISKPNKTDFLVSPGRPGLGVNLLFHFLYIFFAFAVPCLLLFACHRPHTRQCSVYMVIVLFSRTKSTTGGILSFLNFLKFPSVFCTFSIVHCIKMSDKSSFGVPVDGEDGNIVKCR